MEIVLDKRVVAGLSFDAIPVVSGGKIVGTEQNTKNHPYLLLDAHPSAPTGFGIRVNKSSKTYVLKLRVDGKVITTTVGRHPDLLLGNDVKPERDARFQASELSLRLRRGEDVNAAKREARKAKEQKVRTLRDLFDEWIIDYHADVKRRKRTNSILSIEGARKRLGDKLLDKPAHDVTWLDLDEFYSHEAGQEGHQTAAELTIAWVSAVFGKANDKITIEAMQAGTEPQLFRNPAVIFRKTGKMRTKAEKERDYKRKGVRNPLSRTAAGFRAWLDYVLAARTRPIARGGADYCLTTLIFGARPVETRMLMWWDRLPTVANKDDVLNFVDLQRREVVFQATKNDNPLSLPLPDFLYRVLQERFEMRGDSQYVFPGRRGGHMTAVKSFAAGIEKATGVKFRPHDLRRTLANVANSMALPSLLVKQLLNHTLGDVTALYVELGPEQLLKHMNDIEMRMLDHATVNPLKLKKDVTADVVEKGST